MSPLFPFPFPTVVLRLGLVAMRDDEDVPPIVTARARRIDDVTCVVITSASPSSPARVDVIVREPNGTTHVGTLDFNDDAPFEGFEAFARAALGASREDDDGDDDDAFVFAFERDTGEKDEMELVFRRREDVPGANAGERSGREDGNGNGNGSASMGFEAVPTGVVILKREREAVDRTLALARALEASEARRRRERATSARATRACEDANETNEKMSQAMDEMKEDLARRFIAMMNAKKAEMVRLRDGLDAAEMELEEARLKLARRVETGAVGDAAGSLGIDVDDDFDDGNVDGDEYTTDEDIDPTQKGGRISLRKKFGKSQSQSARPSQPSQRPSQASRSQRASAHDADAPPSQTTKRSKRAAKSKSFLADTLALLDAE